MDESTRAVIIIVLALVLLLVLAIYGSRFMLNRAIKKVIKAFRENNALSAGKALLPEELGLVRRTLFQFNAFRDYRPWALEMLRRSNIIQQTDDGRLFLSEEDLARTMPGSREPTARKPD